MVVEFKLRVSDHFETNFGHFGGKQTNCGSRWNRFILGKPFLEQCMLDIGSQQQIKKDMRIITIKL
jgi:hypothetical protein